MARYPGKVEPKQKAGNKEASGFMESSFNGLSSALWMVIYALVFIAEALLTVVALGLALISTATGWIAATANAIAGITAKFAGLVSDLRDDTKEAFTAWKARKDRIAVKARQLEAQEYA